MSSSRHWVIVVNQSSGKGRAGAVKQQVAAALVARGHSFDFIEAIGVEDARKSIDALLVSHRPIEGLLVIGGDGTVHHVVKSMVQSGKDLPIGLIPMGNGNDFARQLGLYGRTIPELIGSFTSEAPITIDILQMHDHLALQVIRTGFDATVSARARRMPKAIGNLRYVLALLLQLGALSTTRYRLVINGMTREVEATLVAIANGRNYGRGMLVSPGSINDDGVFEVVIVGPVSRWKLLLLFPRIFSGSHINHPLVETFQATNLEIEADTIAEADGEPLFSNPLNHRIGTKQLRTWRMA
jgi:diacylglycerol kinase (ATP)